MKCPKCGYISFDFNRVCPKCSKDVGAEQAKLNIPSFRPEAPSLLGALIGEADESGVGVGIGTSTGIDTGEHGMGVDFEDSGAVDTGEVGFGDSLEMDEMDISFESAEESVSGFDSGEHEPSAAETEVPVEESVTDFDLESDEEEITMETGDISEEEAEAERIATPEPGIEEEELGIDLDDVSLDDSGLAQALEEEGAVDLDDLKIDESGELKVGTGVEGPEEVEKGLEAGELSLEEPSPEESAMEEIEEESEEVDIDLDALSTDVQETSKAPKEGEDLSLDLDDLDIELDLDEPEKEPS
jgi:hypothetical protein